MDIHITHIDTACILLEIGTFKILTDPTLDDAGGLYYHGFGAVSRKTEQPAVPLSVLKDIDLILLSHDQHKDNLDEKGRAFTAGFPYVISTPAAAKRMPNVTGLNTWQTHAVHTPKVPGLQITATPAQHRPGWMPEFISGKVTGFIIEYAGQQDGVLYIAGDTIYFTGIDEVGRRYKVDTGIFNLGAVQFRYLSGFGKYTMDSKGLIRAASVLQPRKIIPVHHSGWTHFKEQTGALQKVLRENSLTRDRTIFLHPGQRTLI
jgi:L-ascorbate metabolism protein UlaG (beta-lactamase superfamily)